MAPLEPWEKVFVNAVDFPKTVHGQLACVDCHGGVQSADKDTAHAGLVPNPSEGPTSVCGDCHIEMAETFTNNSLHSTMAGYFKSFEERSTPENHPAFEEAYNNHCAKCHTTCGDCHVSQPGSVGGGLLNGHLFEKTPPMTRTCTACHGSRVGDEFLGKHEGIPGDVHFREGRMNCVSCHDDSEMHGEDAECSTCHTGPEVSETPPPDHRYSGMQSPRCETCHTTVTTGQDGIQQHQLHGADLACQVCHSVSYNSCDSCHVAISETTGNPYYETQGTYLTFFIGRNTLKSYDRPYEYVTVRHVPVDSESYAYYGENLLPNFNSAPTWRFTTPHNIQRSTPQNASCAACHGNAEIFLTADKVRPEELLANANVIVDLVPPPVAELINSPALPADHAGRSVCLTCHQNGTDGPKPPASHAKYLDTGCTSCHTQP